jgi:hypothetical protein
MCIFGGQKSSPPALPPPPPQAATVGGADVAKARSDEQARLRAMSNTGSTLLTNPATIDDAGTTGKKTLGT